VAKELRLTCAKMVLEQTARDPRETMVLDHQKAALLVKTTQ
jgi:hypothetical protein